MSTDKCVGGMSPKERMKMELFLSLMKGRVPTLKPGISGWLFPESYPGESFLVSFLIGLGGLRSTSPEVTRGDL